MKKRRIAVISGILVLTVLAIFLSALFFPLQESDLTGNALQSAGESYHQKISGFIVLDSESSNNNIAFFYQFELENGEERSYAVSYEKHLLFPRYRFASYADASGPGSGGVLIAPGMPREIVYDISGYSLKYEDSALNYSLTIMIRAFIPFVLLMLVLLGKRIHTKSTRGF